MSPGAIRDIHFSRFRVTASAGSQWVGKPGMLLQRIRISDFDWHVHGGTMNDAFVSEMPTELSHHGYHGVHDQPSLPAALYGTYLEDVTFENVRVHWHHPSPVWHDGILIEKSSGTAFYNVELRQPKNGVRAAFHCRGSDDLILQGCRAEHGTQTFLKVEASSPANRIRCLNISKAQTPFHVDAKIFEAGNLYSKS